MVVAGDLQLNVWLGLLRQWTVRGSLFSAPSQLKLTHRRRSVRSACLCVLLSKPMLTPPFDTKVPTQQSMLPACCSLLLQDTTATLRRQAEAPVVPCSTTSYHHSFFISIWTSSTGSGCTDCPVVLTSQHNHDCTNHMCRCRSSNNPLVAQRLSFYSFHSHLDTYVRMSACPLTIDEEGVVWGGRPSATAVSSP